jgi:hypothetical protein
LRVDTFIIPRRYNYEEEHLVPLELGGAPNDMRNIWPEPWVSVDGWTADRKDELENVLNHLVWSGRVSPIEARRSIATNWIDAYMKYVTGTAVTRGLGFSDR